MKHTSSLGDVERVGDVVFPRKVTYTLYGGDEPEITTHFEIREGRPELVELIVRAKPKGRGLRASDMDLLLEALVSAAFAKVALLPRTDEEGAVRGMTPPRDDRERWQAKGAAGSARPRRQRQSRPIPQAELEEVARIYKDNLAGKPTETVATFLGYSMRTAARRVKQAEEAGLLPPTEPGKKRG
ncbi:hypothetical protein AB0P21_07015 [Kribbella sp. NPDC056861]|uniref:hypothetical protein n=1 Tax=Kribbella sp. NPDC056861 TaxID=3154857 RepID=UPI003429E64A